METKFNFKSQICTTREQSERLLALGLKKETADMVWLDHALTEDYDDWRSEPIYKDWEGWQKDGIPAWSIYEHKFCLGTNKDKIIEECVTTGNRILAFPTAEMRDAFYENFKEEIESCKELL